MSYYGKTKDDRKKTDTKYRFSTQKCIRLGQYDLKRVYKHFFFSFAWVINVYIYLVLV